MISLRRRDWFGVAAFDPGPACIGRGGFLYLLDEVGSTSDFLLDRGDPADGRLCRWDGWGWQVGDRQSLSPPSEPRAGSIVVARRQTTGRGRMGRSWHGGEGLAMSWLIAPLPVARAARLAVWTGLSAVQSLRELTGEPIRLKWPNDLRLHGRKLGGILLDMIMRGTQSRFVAGIGVNVGDWGPRMPADLRDTSIALQPAPERWSTLSHLAGAIMRRWEAEAAHFLEAGWPEYRDAFEAVDDLAGRRIVLACGRETLTGVAEGIDDDGALKLRLDDGGLHRLHAGDVHITDTGDAEA